LFNSFAAGGNYSRPHSLAAVGDYRCRILLDFWLTVPRETKSRPHILHKYYSRQRQPGNVVDYSCLRQRKS